MSKRRRTPTGEELQLWRRVADSATPLERKPLADMPKPAAIISGTKRTEPEGPPPIEPFDIGTRAQNGRNSVTLAPSIVQQLSRQPVQMDQKAFGKLTRGKLEPEARIDLHGMTLERAHTALTSFILGSAASGRRLVLVITGKGKARDDTYIIPERRGVLRHHVPEWLRSGGMRPVVMQVAPAHQKHGGSGAYYVYLRRNR